MFTDFIPGLIESYLAAHLAGCARNNGLRVMNPMLPLISVIIPTYNRKHCLGRALDSVLAQCYPCLEIIVVDDGSSDGSAAFVELHYPQVKLIQQAQAGVSAARNCGIAVAQGEWLAFLDSDDAWQPNKISTQMAALIQAGDYKICHTDEIWIRNGRRVNPMNKHQKQGGWVFIANLKLCLISPSSVVLHSSLMLQLGNFDESLPACEDYDLWLRVTAHYPVLYLDEALTLKYGGHADQLSKRYWGMDRFRIRAIEKVLQIKTLKKSDRDAALSTLCEKIQIYLQGAKKRQKTADIHYYSELLKCYQPD